MKELGLWSRRSVDGRCRSIIATARYWIEFLRRGMGGGHTATPGTTRGTDAIRKHVHAHSSAGSKSSKRIRGRVQRLTTTSRPAAGVTDPDTTLTNPQQFAKSGMWVTDLSTVCSANVIRAPCPSFPGSLRRSARGHESEREVDDLGDVAPIDTRRNEVGSPERLLGGASKKRV